MIEHKIQFFISQSTKIKACRVLHLHKRKEIRNLLSKQASKVETSNIIKSNIRESKE